MTRNISKAGPWLFALTLLWFMGGNYLIDLLDRNHRAQAHRLHPALLKWDATAHIVLQTDDPSRQLPNLKLRFVAGTTQVLVHNINLHVNVASTMHNGIRQIKFSQAKRNPGSEFSPREGLHDIGIDLPLSVQTLDFLTANSVTLSAESLNPMPELNLTLQDCKTNLQITHLQVHQLKLYTNCTQNQTTSEQFAEFNLGAELKIDELIANLPVGKLSYRSSEIPATIRLNLGDRVMLQANSQFLRSSHFGKAPQNSSQR